MILPEMKRLIAITILLFLTSICKCIEKSPYHGYSPFYVAELIYSYELALESKNSNIFSIGIGTSGTLFYLDEKQAFIFSSVERRQYFKIEQFKNFFYGEHIGPTYLTDFTDENKIGLVPGMKIGYKARLSQLPIFEFYLDITLPIIYDIGLSEFSSSLPVISVAIRLGLCTLNRIKSEPGL